MAERGGGAAALVAVGLLCLMACSDMANADTYTVGGAAGWNVRDFYWPRCKIFNVGDVLVFNYDPTIANVAAVTPAGYRTCTVTSDSRIYSSGSDHITLRTGPNYFISGVPGQCHAGMKIAVTAV